MRFKVLYKDKTPKGSNFFKLLVEFAKDIWEEAVYFGNTVPTAVTGLTPYKSGWIASIQKHTSRDRDTGRFKGARR